MNTINFTFNILITGNKGVGKTSIINKYTNKDFNNYSNKNIKLLNNNEKFNDFIVWLDNYCIKLNIIDHYDNNNILLHYSIADFIIIVCDITNIESYNIDEYINNKKNYCDKRVEYIIINNKVDKINIFNEKIEYTTKYQNISAKTNYGINILFKSIIRKLIDKYNKITKLNSIDFTKIEHIIDYNHKKSNFFMKLFKICC